MHENVKVKLGPVGFLWLFLQMCGYFEKAIETLSHWRHSLTGQMRQSIQVFGAPLAGLHK